MSHWRCAAAITGRAQALNLTRLAEQQGLDRSTLPFDWSEFLQSFLLELDEELHEAQSTGSPLRGRLDLNEVFRLRCELTSRLDLLLSVGMLVGTPEWDDAWTRESLSVIERADVTWVADKVWPVVRPERVQSQSLHCS